jgi:hypothetical protein
MGKRLAETIVSAFTLGADLSRWKIGGTKPKEFAARRVSEGHRKR